MPKIEINEQDLTSPGALAEDFDVVYIPGFVNLDCINLWSKDNKYIGLEYKKPHLFTSVDDFRALCGTRPAEFKEDQMYVSLNGIGVQGFAEHAVPSDRTMFHAGDLDPAYILAVELLAQGLNVLYERMNEAEQYVPAVMPTQWTNEDYSEYYFNKPTYVKVTDSIPPAYERGKYYLLDRDDGVGTPIITILDGYAERLYPLQVEDTPEDWNEIYSKCYTKKEVQSQITRDDIYPVAYNLANTSKYYDEWALTCTKDDANGPTELKAAVSIPSTTDPVMIKVDTKIETDEDGEPYNTYTVTLATEGTPLVCELTKEGEEVIGLSVTIGGTTYEAYHLVGGKLTAITEFSRSAALTNVVLCQVGSPEGPQCLAVDQVVNADGPNNFTPSAFVERWSNKTTLAEQKKWFRENVVRKESDMITIKNMYTQLAGAFDIGNEAGIVDLGNYSIKYLTSGGYPVYEYNGGTLATAMLNMAKERGDCVALIDHTDNIDREQNINTAGSLYDSVRSDSSLGEIGEYGAMFTPWASYNRVTTDYKVDASDKLVPDPAGPVRMPGSYAYLTALADSIKTNAPWLAVAGSARGSVLNLAKDGMTTVIPNGVADKMQPRSGGIAVNAITNIRPYGETIWGNRTLKLNEENLVATSFLNVRNLVSDVKKVCYRTARKLTFEQNNDILWLNFKSSISPTLDRMVSGYGLSGYKIVRNTSHEKALEKATLCVKIYLYPVYPVEDFYIDIVLKDDEITVE